MRPTALIPALLCAGALTLTFLCLFAGHKRAFMEDYHLLTLNTSRIGSNLLNDGNGPISSLLNNVTDITDTLGITDDINNAVASFAERVGVEDFYSVHILDYCYGSYVPVPVANGTVKQGDIHKNVSACSNRTAMFTWDPAESLERSLNESGVNISLDDLQWPEDIQTGIDALHILQKAVFVLYCISIGLIFICFLAALLALFADGRLGAAVNVLLTLLAFLSVGIASGIVTAVIVKGSDVINKYGKEIGVESHWGGKFLAITWSATGLMLLAVLVWSIECCFGRRRRRGSGGYVAKHG